LQFLQFLQFFAHPSRFFNFFNFFNNPRVFSVFCEAFVVLMLPFGGHLAASVFIRFLSRLEGCNAKNKNKRREMLLANKRRHETLPEFSIEDFETSKRCMCCDTLVPPIKIPTHAFVCGLIGLMQIEAVNVEEFFYQKFHEIEAKQEKVNLLKDAQLLEASASESLSQIRYSPSPAPNLPSSSSSSSSSFSPSVSLPRSPPSVRTAVDLEMRQKIHFPFSPKRVIKTTLVGRPPIL